MKERLQKIISRAGLASRRTAEKWITEGRVRVNGKIVRQLGSKADPDTDTVEVDGRSIIDPGRHRRYYVLNKPAGCITAVKDPQGRPTVIDLLKRKHRHVYPVGRLDYNTTGLLILTDDGSLARYLQHPSSRIPRVYDVKVTGNLSQKALKRLERGIRLGDKTTLPCTVTVRRTSERSQWLRITLREGQNRQIHRMMAVVGATVVKIRRIQFGSLKLGRLPVGAYRELTPAEITSLTGSS